MPGAGHVERQGNRPSQELSHIVHVAHWSEGMGDFQLPISFVLEKQGKVREGRVT
jgi:hypothetical protein